MSHAPSIKDVLWRRLAIFTGGATSEAITTVCADIATTPHAVTAVLEALVRQGRVVAEQAGNSVRYQLPEPQRAAAQSQLDTNGETATVAARLVDYAGQLAEQSLAEAFGSQRAVWMQRLVKELPSLRAALAWLVARGDAAHGLQLAYLLQELWFEEDHTSEGRQWFAALLALPEATTRTTQRAQALDLAGALALNQGDYADARALKEEAIAILRELGVQTTLGFVLLHLGHLLGYAQGDFAAARARYQEGLELLQGSDHAEGTAHALANLANVAILTGDYRAAQPLVSQSLRRYVELGLMYAVADSLQRAAGIAAGMGQAERALRLAGASAFHCAAIGVSQPQVFLDRHEQMIAQARQALDASTQAVLWAEGQAMTLEEAVAYALT